jgi:hypothetical protein
MAPRNISRGLRHGHVHFYLKKPTRDTHYNLVILVRESFFKIAYQNSENARFLLAWSYYDAPIGEKFRHGEFQEAYAAGMFAFHCKSFLDIPWEGLS